MSNKRALEVPKEPSDLLVLLSMEVGPQNYDKYMQAIGLKRCPKAYFLGDNMAYLRKKHGVTKEQLAYGTLISLDKISRYELETDIPDVLRALAIAEYFSVSVHDLIREDLKGKEN